MEFAQAYLKENDLDLASDQLASAGQPEGGEAQDGGDLHRQGSKIHKSKLQVVTEASGGAENHDQPVINFTPEQYALDRSGLDDSRA